MINSNDWDDVVISDGYPHLDRLKSKCDRFRRNVLDGTDVAFLSGFGLCVVTIVSAAWKLVELVGPL